MPTWSDLYHLVKPSHGLPIPPLEKGMLVSIKVNHKFKVSDIHSFQIELWVKVIDVIGDDLVAQTLRKVEHIKRKELMIFDKSYVISIEGSWEFACKYQTVKVSKGVLFYEHKITDIRGWAGDTGPLETGITVYSEQDDLGDYYFTDWHHLPIPKLLSFAPHIEEVLKKGTSHSLIGGIFLPIDIIERNDDEDEWQYHR